MYRPLFNQHIQRAANLVFVLIVLAILISFGLLTSLVHQKTNSRNTQDLRSRLSDLERIRQSVKVELRQLEKERSKMLRDKFNLITKNDKLQAQISNTQAQLRQLELDLSANRRHKLEQFCSSERVAPIIFNPLKAEDLDTYDLSPINNLTSNISLPQGRRDINRLQHSDYALDYSLCPLTKTFSFSLQVNPFSNHKLENLFRLHSEFIIAEHACLNIMLPPLTVNDMKPIGINNLIISTLDYNGHPSVFGHDKASVASAYFPRGSYREHVDIVIPSILSPSESYNNIIESIPPQSPLERKYMACYFSHDKSSPSKNRFVSSIIERTLKTIHRSSIDDPFLFKFNCDQGTNEHCYEQRETIIGNSLFLIIISDETHDIDLETNDMVYRALSKGTIPVIFRKVRIRLPFAEVIDWRRASIILPTDRLPEVHFILKSFSPVDLYSLKYHGRRIFEKYLATSKQVVDTIIDTMRLERLNYPPPPINNHKTYLYYPSKSLKIDRNCSTITCRESQSDSLVSLLSTETLGPKERPFASPAFRHNMSLVLNSAYDLWNNPMYSPSHLYPSLPNDPVAPSEYKFYAPDQGYRPIAEGQGGSGIEFSRSLGGDFPNEQFTVVLLTYERRTLLMKTLERLRGMAYLNKIVIVWNSINQRPSIDFIWPDVGVPIELVQVDRNSLNNRFLPFDVIETDAIFSMDDDSPLRPDEIVFAFRVWRQSRDRIVGFPGRYHAWDSMQNAWLYNSNHSCELSMVLTGGAFFHKYYSYWYTYFMPESVRSIVDKFMNCEDIAMNFLVAHLTRKPPIKVTSRWTFHCTNCINSLSEDGSHFKERHDCLNIFASIYGYMPLLSTQHRSDSVLFKTRLPRDKQKCFKFV